MNVERLKLLVTLLEEIRDDATRKTIFNLCTWAVQDVEVDSVIYEVSTNFDDALTNIDALTILNNSNGGHLPEDFCGTAACAVGHACLDPRFNALGLTLSYSSPLYKGMDSWDAVEEFFGLTSWAAEMIFCADTYPTGLNTNIQAVINRINGFINL